MRYKLSQRVSVRLLQSNLTVEKESMPYDWLLRLSNTNDGSHKARVFFSNGLQVYSSKYQSLRKNSIKHGEIPIAPSNSFHPLIPHPLITPKLWWSGNVRVQEVQRRLLLKIIWTATVAGNRITKQCCPRPISGKFQFCPHWEMLCGNTNRCHPDKCVFQFLC